GKSACEVFGGRGPRASRHFDCVDERVERLPSLTVLGPLRPQVVWMGGVLSSGLLVSSPDRIAVSYAARCVPEALSIIGVRGFSACFPLGVKLSVERCFKVLTAELS
ncbi:unnamed protein product, partial [Hapterophycus canaliculatus]